MRFPRLSPRSKKLAKFLVGLRIAFEVIDWIVGKIGYLGVFTSPEDFGVMLERAPLWLQEIANAVWPVFSNLGSLLRNVWDAASGDTGTLVVLAIILLLLVVDPERLRYRLRMAARSLMADEVWLSEADALEALKQSEWAMLRIPHVTETVSAFDLAALQGAISGALSATRTRTIAGMSDAEKAKRKYLIFLG